MGEFDGHFPKWRRASQRWVFFLYESPLHSYRFINHKVLFNMSATYRLSSNTTSLYFQQNPFYWKLNEKFNEKQNFLEGKKDFAAIVVSNCNDKSNRLKLVNELKKYIPVTIFGKCGIPCPNKWNGQIESDACKLNIVKNYKFYFSFENSICKDYITEKFFEIIKYNIIPIVLGGGDYSQYIPKSGYINALNYGQPKDLANYLKYLSKNETAYNSFFEWKKHVIFDNTISGGHICEFCIIMNLDAYKDKIETNNIGNLKNFWNEEKDCKI